MVQAPEKNKWEREISFSLLKYYIFWKVKLLYKLKSFFDYDDFNIIEEIINTLKKYDSKNWLWL